MEPREKGKAPQKRFRKSLEETWGPQNPNKCPEEAWGSEKAAKARKGQKPSWQFGAPQIGPKRPSAQERFRRGTEKARSPEKVQPALRKRPKGTCQRVAKRPQNQSNREKLHQNPPKSPDLNPIQFLYTQPKVRCQKVRLPKMIGGRLCQLRASLRRVQVPN